MSDRPGARKGVLETESTLDQNGEQRPTEGDRSRQDPPVRSVLAHSDQPHRKDSRQKPAAPPTKLWTRRDPRPAPSPRSMRREADRAREPTGRTEDRSEPGPGQRGRQTVLGDADHQQHPRGGGAVDVQPAGGESVQDRETDPDLRHPGVERLGDRMAPETTRRPASATATATMTLFARAVARGRRWRPQR